jgi:hypothetical protein
MEVQRPMPCRSCSSNRQREFGSEVIIHHSGLKNLDKPTVMVFPTTMVCLSCGVAEFTIPQAQLRHLEDGEASRSAYSVRQ